MRRLGLTLAILWLAACSAVQVPQGPSRVTWPVPVLPDALPDQPAYEIGWFRTDQEIARADGTKHPTQCLIDPDHHALDSWLKAHLYREVRLGGEVQKSQETIRAINRLNTETRR